MLANDDAGGRFGDAGDLFALAVEQIVVEIAIAGNLKRQVRRCKFQRHREANDGARRTIYAIREGFTRCDGWSVNDLKCHGAVSLSTMPVCGMLWIGRPAVIIDHDI